jgi:hypothetical protein
MPLRRVEARPVDEPVPSLMPDDEIYVQHEVHGPIAVRVLSSGTDGCRVAHPDHGQLGVEWSQVLGHKRRAQRAVTLLEQGEDGAIGVDANGKRIYIRGALPPPDPEGDAQRMEREGAMLRKAIGDVVGPIQAALAAPRQPLELAPIAGALSQLVTVWTSHLEARATREEAADIRREALDLALIRSIELLASRIPAPALAPAEAISTASMLPAGASVVDPSL